MTAGRGLYSRKEQTNVAHKTNRYRRVVALTVIAVLLIALTGGDYSFASRNPLIDELDDTVNMLALIIQRAERSKAAHPAFLADLRRS